jgi:hypothetical protein
MNIKHFIYTPGSAQDLNQRGAIEANPQATDARTRKHLLREARKANLRRLQRRRTRR